MSLDATQKEKCRLQLAEAEAKWVNAVYNDSIGRLTITRRWKVGNDRVDIALEYLNTYGWVNAGAEGTLDTIVAPTMGDEAFPGTFRQVRCFDGTTVENPGWVYQELRRVQAPANVTALAALPSLVSSEQEIVRPFGFTSGTKWDVAHVFYDLNPTSKAAVEAFTGAELVTRIAGSGWTFADKKWQEGEDNTASFVVLFKKVAWTNRWIADAANGIVGARTVGEQNPNDTTGERTATVEADAIADVNLAADYAEAAKNNVGSGLTEGYGTGLYVVDAVSKAEAADGERVVRAVRSDVKGLISDEQIPLDALTINLTPEIGIKNATATRRWKRVHRAYKNVLVAAGGAARSDFTCPETGATSYTHAEVSISDHGNGVYSVTQTGFAFAQTLIDQYKDVRGKAVYFTEKDESVVTSSKLYVRWPVYRYYHIFRATWIDCWNACDSKDGGGDPPKYPITGNISIGTFGGFMYHGQVTTFRGFTDWIEASTKTVDSTPDPDPEES